MNISNDLLGQKNIFCNTSVFDKTRLNNDLRDNSPQSFMNDPGNNLVWEITKTGRPQISKVSYLLLFLYQEQFYMDDKPR